jgi:hypothetical protein
MRIRLFFLFLVLFTTNAFAHPLGQYTINHFARLETGVERVAVRYVVDWAELAAFPEIQTADTDGNGLLSAAETQAYLERIVPQLLTGLSLRANNERVALRVIEPKLSLPPGTANLPTLRLECELAGAVKVSATTRFQWEDNNHATRQGWHELVVVASSGITIFDSTAYGNGLTDE